MIEAIPFKIDYLNQLKFAKIDDYVVFGLPDNGACVKSMEVGDDIIVRKENGEWVLVTQKDDAHFCCRFDYIPLRRL